MHAYMCVQSRIIAIFAHTIDRACTMNRIIIFVTVLCFHSSSTPLYFIHHFYISGIFLRFILTGSGASNRPSQRIMNATIGPDKSWWITVRLASFRRQRNRGFRTRDISGLYIHGKYFFLRSITVLITTTILRRI